MPGDLGDDPEARGAGDQRATDDRDAPDVAGDVGVFLGGRRPRAATRTRTARLRRGRCVRPLAGRLGLASPRPRSRPRAGRRAPLPPASAMPGAAPATRRPAADVRPAGRASRSSGRALDRPALARVGSCVPLARLAMVWWRASIDGVGSAGEASVGTGATAEAADGRGSHRRRVARHRDRDRLLDSGCPPEDPRIDLDALIEPNLGALVVGLVAVVLALAAACVILARRTRRTRRAARAASPAARRVEASRPSSMPTSRRSTRVARARRRGRAHGRSSKARSAGRSSASGWSGTTRSRRPAATRASRSPCSTRPATAGCCRACTPASGTRVYAKAITAGRSDAGPVRRGDARRSSRRRPDSARWHGGRDAPGMAPTTASSRPRSPSPP